MNYLDHAATTPVRHEVIEIMTKMMKEDFGNPSSLHRMGLKAEKALAHARDQVADFLSCKPEQIVFTSGGTEGNNLGMRGCLPVQIPKGKNLCIGAIEHSSVYEVAKELKQRGLELRLLPVDAQGRIQIKKAMELIDENTILLSVQHVNNEIGTIQPIEELSNVAKQVNPKVHVHVDGVQAVGKIPVSLKKLNVDSYAFSGHKINATKGIGALFLRLPKNAKRILWGSGQEGGLRPGTENVPAICGLGLAVQCLKDEFQAHEQGYRKCRRVWLEGVMSEIDEVTVNTPLDLQEAAPHILSLSFKGVKAEILLHMLEMEEIYVSTGSACSSKMKGNRILREMKIADDRVEGTLRISYGWDADLKEQKEAIAILDQCVREVRELTMR